MTLMIINWTKEHQALIKVVGIKMIRRLSSSSPLVSVERVIMSRARLDLSLKVRQEGSCDLWSVLHHPPSATTKRDGSAG